MALGLLSGTWPAPTLQRGGAVAPLFPLWLAGCYALFGADVPSWVLGLLNAALRAGSVALVFLIARRLADRRAALVAAALMTIDPWELFWVPFLTKEALGVFLMLLAGVLVHRSLNHDGSAPVVAGLALVFAAMGFYGCIFLVLLAFRLRVARGVGGSLRWAFQFLGVPMVMLAGLWLVVARDVMPAQAVSFVRSELIRSTASLVSATETRGYSPDADTYLLDPPPPNGPGRWTVWPNAVRIARSYARRVVNLGRPVFAGSKWSTFLVLGVPYLVLVGLSIAGFVDQPERLRFCFGAAGVLAIMLLGANGGIRQRQYVTPWLFPAAAVGLLRLAGRRPLAKLILARTSEP